MLEKIVSLARTLTGTGEDEEDLLESLCQAAETLWMGRLREDVISGDCKEALCCAAAFTAAADLAAGQGGGVTSFTAGEISVKGCGGSEAADRAAALRQTAERLMAHYAQAEDFAFKGVRG